MSKETESKGTSDSTSSKSKPTQSTASAVDARLIKEQEQGFRGVEVDPTPNENYTVSGVTSNAPTPETDVSLASSVREATGIGLSALEASEREKTERGEK